MFLNDTIIVEEKGEYQTGSSEYSWTIDSLDGTMNYIIVKNVEALIVAIRNLKYQVQEKLVNFI